MKRVVASLTLMLTLGPGAAWRSEAEAGRFEDPEYGFSLVVPSLGDAANAVAVQRLAVAGPARDGFAANCNVQVQFFGGGLDAYVDLSLRQFSEAGMEVLRRAPRRVSGSQAMELEYVGAFGGHELHFLALAVGGADRVWLLTCSALEKSYTVHRDAFGRTLDSFTVRAPAPSTP